MNLALNFSRKRKCDHKSAPQSDLQVKHKKAVFEWIKGLEDEVPAADANWENGYTELVVGKRHRSCSAHSSLQHVADGNSLLWDETIRKLYKQISIHQIFEKDPRDDTQPCTVLLSGAAGIGKSTAVHKILFDWARDAQYKKFKYVFLFKFGELNLLEEEEAEMSLVRLIMRYYKHLNDSDLVMREILHMPESVLFIFDGLDEYKYQLNFAQRTLCLNPEAPYPVHILIISLLCGELLKKCSVLITSRPSALQSLYVDGFDRFAKVLGFFPEQQKMYIQKFFANTVQSNKAIKYVQQNAMLSSVVHIPFYCRVICCVLLDHFTVITGDKNAPLPQTNTELLVMFLYSILSCHSEEPEEKKCMLVKLGKMAYYGLSKKTSVFYEKYEISSYDLQSSLSCPANSDFLFEILKRENTLEHTAYKFLNVTMQEFMAACSFFLDPPEDIENLFVKLDSCENGDYDILTQFLAGLANLTVTEKLEGVLKEFQRKTAERILEWVKEKAQTALQGGDKNEQMKAFTCLAETQNKELIRDLIGKDFKLDYTPAALNPLYYSVLNTVISCCGEVEELKFSHSDMSLSALKQMLPGLSLCKRVIMWSCNFKSEGCKALSSAICASDSRVTELHLDGSSVQSSGVHELCEGLTKPNSKVQILGLWSCNLRSDCCKDLSLALSAKCSSLTKLVLVGNTLGDSGVHHLCEGLRSMNCKLQHLCLSSCSLASKSCQSLSSVLSVAHSSLLELELSGNQIADAGVRALCKGLKSPNCKLQKLNLTSCNLTSSCCESLSLAISTQHSCLKELQLWDNALEDLGVNILCDGLKNSKLENLWLRSCSLTSTCCSALSSVLSQESSQLTELELSSNQLGDRGVDLLSESLRNPYCKLKKLWLGENGVSEVQKIILESLREELDQSGRHTCIYK